MEAKEALEATVNTLLGASDVATITANTLRRHNVEVSRFAEQIEAYNLVPRDERAFTLKPIVANPESPEEFGLLIRRVGKAARERTA
jgi:hypothetical protein